MACGAFHSPLFFSFFFHPSALTLIDGDSFSPGHPAGFHLDAAIIKGQYTERLRRIAGEEGRDRRRPEDPRRLSSQVPGAEWASRRSTAFHQPRSEDRWRESTQAAAETINQPAARGSEPGVQREPIKSRMATDLQELAEASETPSVIGSDNADV